MTSLRRRLLPLALALPTVLLSACAGTTPETSQTEQIEGSTAPEDVEDHDHTEGHDHDHTEGERDDDHDSPAATEAPAPQPRLAAAYDDGVLVIDAQTFEILLDAPLPGVVGLEPAGDGRHVLVTVAGDEPCVRLLDTGAWSSVHGDHFHHFVATPSLTDPASLPDGVVPGEVGQVPDGAVVTLGTDGSLHMLDPVTGEVTSAPVLDAWEPSAAAAATPALALLGETAYVSDPVTGSIHAVDVVTGAVFASGTVPHAVRNLAAVSG